MQDLKAGFLLGSTPIVLQVMQVIGIIGPGNYCCLLLSGLLTLFPALLLAPVVGLLIRAYGLGSPTPDFPDPLPGQETQTTFQILTF